MEVDIESRGKGELVGEGKNIVGWVLLISLSFSPTFLILFLSFSSLLLYFFTCFISQSQWAIN
jgi:hypothetical protein